jgi:hypothetical protein
VKDNGIPPMSSITIVEVPVDRNLNAPKFATTADSSNIFEIQSTGTVFKTVVAADPDKVGPQPHLMN